MVPESLAYIIAGGIIPLVIAVLGFVQTAGLRKAEDARWERQASRDEARAVAEHERALAMRREDDEERVRQERADRVRDRADEFLKAFANAMTIAQDSANSLGSVSPAALVGEPPEAAFGKWTPDVIAHLKVAALRLDMARGEPEGTRTLIHNLMWEVDQIRRELDSGQYTPRDQRWTRLESQLADLISELGKESSRIRPR